MSSEESASLAAQCLALCQTLANQGKSFSFCLKVGNNFSFSLDSTEKTQAPQPRKRTSPSTLRRNERRRLAFIAKKKSPGSAAEKAADEIATSEATEQVTLVKESEVDVHECEQCDYKTSCKAGLNRHIGHKHKTIPQIDGNNSINESETQSSHHTKEKQLVYDYAEALRANFYTM